LEAMIAGPVFRDVLAAHPAQAEPHVEERLQHRPGAPVDERAHPARPRPAQEGLPVHAWDTSVL